MANALTVQVVGLQEAVRGLDGFSKGVRRKQMRIAISKGASLLRADAARRAPRDSGTLAKNLGIKVSLSKDEMRVNSRTGGKRGIKVMVRVNSSGNSKKIATFRRKKDGTIKVTGQGRIDKATAAGATMALRAPSRYLHLVEHGTRRHVVSTKKKKVLASAGRMFGRSVTVGARPKPFLADTARSMGRTATAATIGRLKSGIEEERKIALARANSRARKAAGV